MSVITVDAAQWAQEQFGAADLGDRRRTKRLVAVATRMAEHPSGSLPAQNESWSDLKATYGLFDEEDVTFEAIARPHWQATRARTAGAGRVLVVGDTTETDFGIRRRAIDGLGPTGNGGGRGFLLHSAIALRPESDEVFGLLGQRIRYRQPAPKGENTTQRLRRDRESEIWGQVIDTVGRPPEGTQYVHVLDRGADNFEVRCHALEHGTDYIIRVAQWSRKVRDDHGGEVSLRTFLEALPVAGEYSLEVPAQQGRPARTAVLTVSCGAAQVPEPAQKSPYVKRQQRGRIPVWYVWARERNPPSTAEALDWVLESNQPVTSMAAARGALNDYGKRWLIEEWHKALKTGCQLEKKQLKTARRLEALTAVVSVVAIRLIQLRSEARTNPERPARACVPTLYLACLQRALRRSPEAMTVRDFWRGLAKLGGFLGRKRDGEPGWITIWRGWEKLVLIVRGAELFMGAHSP